MNANTTTRIGPGNAKSGKKSPKKIAHAKRMIGHLEAVPIIKEESLDSPIPFRLGEAVKPTISRREVETGVPYQVAINELLDRMLDRIDLLESAMLQKFGYADCASLQLTIADVLALMQKIRAEVT